MAFAVAGLKLIKHAVGGGPNLWYYETTDVHTDVDATDYFAKMGFGTSSDNTTRGMKVGDLVFVFKTTATVGVTVHVVSAVAADGDVTIAPAILA